MVELTVVEGGQLKCRETFKPDDQRLGSPQVGATGTSLNWRLSGGEDKLQPAAVSLTFSEDEGQRLAGSTTRLAGPRKLKTLLPEGKVGGSRSLLQRKHHLSARDNPWTTSQNAPAVHNGSALCYTDLRLHAPECPREKTATAPPPEMEVLPNTLSL